MLTTSFIIASYRRPHQLAETLRRFPAEPMRRFGAELVLAGSAPDDETEAVMRDYARTAPFPVKVVMAAEPGFAHAQNVAVAQSCGELVVFTDDDCYVADDYLDQLHRRFDPAEFQYGMGEILMVHADDEPRVANTSWWPAFEKSILPPHGVIAPGAIQGANMFFLRSVLDAIGGVRQVGPRDNNDIMTAFMASRAGYTGALLRGPRVHHDHGRKIGSREAEKTLEIYATISGSYYAQLAAIGMPAAFELWKRSIPDNKPVDLKYLEIEFRAAADEIAWMRETQAAAAKPTEVESTEAEPDALKPAA